MPEACQVYAGLMPHVWWPWNVDDLKKQLAVDLQTTNVAAQTCAGLDASLKTQWSLFYDAAIGWSASKTSWFGLGAQADQGQSYQCSLYSWQQALAGASCQIVARNPNPPASDAGANALRWTGIAVASVAGAYVVGQIVTVALEAAKAIPKRRTA